MSLRGYQEQAIADLRATVSKGSRAPLLQAATGLGKTVIISAMIRSAADKGRKVLVIVPRRQLVYQTSEKLNDWGVQHGIIMSGEVPSFMPRVQVASVNTLYRRCFDSEGNPVQPQIFGKGMPLPPADLVVIDEAHANFGSMCQKILAEYPEAIKIGMTATPCRADGRGLGEVYDSIVSGPSIEWAQANGFLSRLRYFGPSEWDMTGVKVQAGDYHQGQLSERVNDTQLIGDVVENWERIAPDRVTVVFAVDRKHARALHEAFTQAGHGAEYIDGQTENGERHEIFRRLESGESRVLCSVAVVDMGWDFPLASCAILARPTKSIARYLQAVGRILRPAEGKEDGILIDHTGAVRELGFIEDERRWTLAGVERKQKETPQTDPADVTTITCPGCKRMVRPAPQCPECGLELKAKAKKAIEAKQAELQEIERREVQKNGKKMDMAEKQRFFDELLGYALDKGYKRGWVVHAYEARTGVKPWPVWHSGSPATPSKDTRNWITSLNIRRAKAKEKQTRATA